ncbi:MAG: zinc metalloprotease HtpX [Candidatus Methanospirare jalkutatii]|nr:zinc metalloprotease HtpX [Candidatus Methanospirare jalkutatii]
MRNAWLLARMWLCVLLLFALIYGVLSLIAVLTGAGTPIVFAVLAAVVVAAQFFIGPRIIEATMHIRYVSESEYPELHQIVSDLAMRAGIPKPKVGISEIPVPNAFAFGTSKRNARVCVTRKLLQILDRDELESVLAHEISHIKHRDVAVITALSVIPTICYFIYISFFWSGIFGGGGERRENVAFALAIAAIAFIAYIAHFISKLILLYASRIREFYADAGSAEITRKPQALASALYKIIYGNATARAEQFKKELGSMRAFFAADPMSARRDLSDLRQAYFARNGRIDAYELQAFAARAKLSFNERLLEIFSTHPHPVNRLKRLAKYI